jgi:hypothetical protein
MNASLYKTNINKYLNSATFPSNIKCIYGGITENTFEARKLKHVQDNKPPTCDKSWIISDKSITTITIKDMSKLEQYKKLIEVVEQYLIDELDKKFGNKCKNDRNNDGTIAQRGGAGVTIENLQEGDKVKLYIFYLN